MKGQSSIAGGQIQCRAVPLDGCCQGQNKIARIFPRVNFCLGSEIGNDMVTEGGGIQGFHFCHPKVQCAACPGHVPAFTIEEFAVVRRELGAAGPEERGRHANGQEAKRGMEESRHCKAKDKGVLDVIAQAPQRATGKEGGARHD